MNGNRLKLLATLTMFIGSLIPGFAAHAEERVYEFESYRHCLDGWQSRNNSLWECSEGSLRAFSLGASLMNQDFPRFKNGELEFSIAQSVGRGEVVIWFRNAATNSGRQRLRVILEERADGSGAMRIDQVARDRPSNLWAEENQSQRVEIPSFVGTYSIRLQGRKVRLTQFDSGLTFTTETEATRAGRIYLTSSGGEGGFTDFEYVRIAQRSGE